MNTAREMYQSFLRSKHDFRLHFRRTQSCPGLSTGHDIDASETVKQAVALQGGVISVSVDCDVSAALSPHRAAIIRTRQVQHVHRYSDF